MQAVLAIILLLFLAGLLWSLWYVLTNPRRRARHIAAELSVPAVSNSAPLVVGYRRSVSAAAAAFFAIIAANIAARNVTPVLVVVIALCVVLAAFYARLAADPKPVLVIRSDGITLIRQRRVLRWEDIETMAIEQGQGLYGIERYSLVLQLAPHAVDATEHKSRGLVTTNDDTLTILLKLLSPRWDQIARAIHERSGRRPVLPRKYALVPQ
jgi:hypothetical protein